MLGIHITLENDGATILHSCKAMVIVLTGAVYGLHTSREVALNLEYVTSFFCHPPCHHAAISLQCCESIVGGVD